MGGSAFVMSAMTGIAMLIRFGFLVRAMLNTIMCDCVGVACAMLRANLIFFAGMIRTMLGTIMLGYGFVFAMFDAGFAFFTFMLGAMLNAIVFVSSHLMMFAVFRWRYRRWGKRYSGRRRCCRGYLWGNA